jgi:hypothetical protein
LSRVVEIVEVAFPVDSLLVHTASPSVNGLLDIDNGGWAASMALSAHVFSAMSNKLPDHRRQGPFDHRVGNPVVVDDRYTEPEVFVDEA